ncbi:MAG TPA: hypothetical protein VLJ39_05775 [Tepidisphaeraceae bacterium]|nr:hypothetical protein [Tepidisphaeraceae bacterium]
MRSTLSPALIVMIATMLCASTFSRAAAEKTSQYSVFGLFSPDREQDLKDVLENIPEMKLVSLDYEHARATFSYDLEVLFPGYNPKHPPKDTEIEQHLNNLLTKESQGTFRLRPVSATPADKLEKIEIQIGILDCKGCRYAAYQALEKVEGVDHATVTKDNIVRAWIDPAKTGKEALQAALKKARVAIPGVSKGDE